MLELMTGYSLSDKPCTTGPEWSLLTEFSAQAIRLLKHISTDRYLGYFE